MAGILWTDDEMNFIIKNYNNLSDEEMARYLNRSVGAVKQRILSFKLWGVNDPKSDRLGSYKGFLPKVGDRFGILTVVQVIEQRTKSYCMCYCDCNKDVIFQRSVKNLKESKNQNCGCQTKSKLIKRITKHGKVKSPYYTNWMHMRSRCNNPNDNNYKYYGGRGIKICEEWNDFNEYSKWAEKTYEKGKTVHRINNDKGYSPDNCTWATNKEQANAKSTNHLLTAFGETKNISQWVLDTRTVVSEETLRSRIKTKWNHEQAIITPVGVISNHHSFMMKFQTGVVHGELTVLSTYYKNINSNVRVLQCNCLCSCGNKITKGATLVLQEIKKGKIPNCGCIK